MELLLLKRGAISTAAAGVVKVTTGLDDIGDVVKATKPRKIVHFALPMMLVEEDYFRRVEVRDRMKRRVGIGIPWWSRQPRKIQGWSINARRMELSQLLAATTQQGPKVRSATHSPDPCLHSRRAPCS